MKLSTTARAYAALIAATATLPVMASVPASASSASAPAAARSAGTWGNAQRVITPPTNILGSLIGAVSCSRRGYCAAIGSYYPKSHGIQVPYVLTETNGRWSKIKIFNVSALHMTHVNAFPEFVACPSAGNCSVLGGYTATLKLFTVTEKNGTWGKALPAPLPAAIGNFLDLNGLACTSAGNCVAAGGAGLVLSQRNGAWGHAKILPGIPAAGDFSFDSVSCGGDRCMAVGSYIGQDSMLHNLAAMAKNGVWGTAKPIPGSPANEGVGPVACSPDGTCTVLDASNSSSTEFSLSERNGTWSTTPDPIPGALPMQAYTNLACPSAGNCSAAGYYADEPQPLFNLPFVMAEHNGTWSKVELLPGLLRLNNHGRLAHQADINSLSCGAPGNCAVTGFANVNGSAADPHDEAIVVNEVGGRWHFAQVLPGIVRLEARGPSQGESVACWSANHCAAGGLYVPSATATEAPYVVIER